MKVKPEDFPAAMASIKALNMKGMNLTMPHKIMVLDYLDEISPAAKIIGAVNTILVREDGTLFGENTDGKGFVQALKHKGIDLCGKKVTILGAGGAAKAISVECALAGAKEITVVNRTLDKAEELTEVIRSNTPAAATADEFVSGYHISEDTDILINGTSIGFGEDAAAKPDIAYETVTDQMVVVDVVFNPAETLFLQEAKKQGAITVTGLGMLACQGALNFTIWTGVPAPLEIMEQTLAQEFA